MKILSFIFIFILTTSCSHFMERQPNSVSIKPRHLIITVHGLDSNAESFGYFNEVTKAHMEKLTPGYEIDIKPFVYPTGKSEKNGVREFAFGPDGLSQFLTKQNLNKNDKISFVCHSQGGLVTYLWLFKSILEQLPDIEYVKQVDSIITLGTPFWGSKISSMLTDQSNPEVIGLLSMLSDVTRHEISDMAFASDTINTFRNLAIQLDSDPALSKMIDELPVRLINIIGILPQDKNQLFSETNSKDPISGITKRIINLVYSIFKSSYQDNKKIESDIAVPVASSRWNFIYTPVHFISKDETINYNQYKDFSHLVDRSKFIFTESAHFPFDTEKTFSMAYIPQDCLQPTECKHPTYRYVLEHLANCKNNSECNQEANNQIVTLMKLSDLAQYNSFKKIKNTLESFSLQINLKLKPGTIDRNFQLKYLRNRVQNSGESHGNEDWALNDYSIIDSEIINLKRNKKNQISEGSTSDYKIVLGDKKEKRSIDVVSRKSSKDDHADHIRIHITGRIETLNSDKQYDSYMVPLEISIPGLPHVKINAKVKPTYSTFTELDYTQ
jgi:hypothetical protein